MLKTPTTMNTLALAMREKAEDSNRNPRWKYLRGLGLNQRAVFLWAVADINNESGVWRTAIELNG